MNSTFTEHKLVKWMGLKLIDMSVGSKASEASEQTDSKPNVSLENVVREFLRQHDYLHEFRVQKLVYLADLVYQLKNNDRLTDADFKPYMYGSYSEDVRNTLENLKDSVPNEADLQHGKVTTKFNGGPQSVQSQISDEEIIKVVEAVREATTGWTSEELGSWSKDSWLYENTDYDSEMNFSRLDRVSDKVRSDLLKTFPELKDLLPDEQ